MEQFMLFVLTTITLVILDICETVNIIGPQDYCAADKFEPNCNSNELVVIETATYGRMEHGRCIAKQEGNFGCSTDIRNILDSLCSGRHTCDVDTLNRDIFSTKPCGPNIIGYMTISYSCLKATSVKDECASTNKLELTGDQGYLSMLASKNSFGSVCLVAIEVPDGRLVKFTVYNFMKKSGSACYEVAEIKEKDDQKNVHVCQSDPRTKEVMMTSSSHVTVHFSDFQIGESVGSFLLHYEAVGCPKPDDVDGAHMIREGDRAKIKCNNSDSSWFIYCKDNKWTEMDRKCPQDWGISKIFKTKSGFPYGIFLTSFIAVGIGIFLGGFLLFIAINAFQRHQRRLRQAYEAPPIIPDPDYKIYDTCKMDLNFVPGFGTAGRNTITRHQMSPPPVPSQPPEDERRFSRHTYEKPKYNSTDNSPFVEA